MEHLVEDPAARRSLRDAGIAVSILLALPLTLIVEWLGYTMIENAASWGELTVLALFALPLVTALLAIALTLSARPLWLRLSTAALLVLAPPAILFGAFHG